MKNIAFLMNKAGQWTLSPAFDVSWSYNPTGKWTSQHQMSINGKRDHFTLEDFRTCAATAGLMRGRAESMLEEIVEVVSQWPRYADEAGVPTSWRETDSIDVETELSCLVTLLSVSVRQRRSIESHCRRNVVAEKRAFDLELQLVPAHLLLEDLKAVAS